MWHMESDGMKGGEDGGGRCLQETNSVQLVLLLIHFQMSFFWINQWIHFVFKMLNNSVKIIVQNLLKLLMFLMDLKL